MGADKILLTILALPLIGALINGTLGKNMPKAVVGAIATGVMFTAFALALVLFGSVHKQQLVHLFTMISLEGFELNARLQLDSLSIWMTLIVTGVGSLIHLFSMGYMSHDKGYYKSNIVLCSLMANMARNSLGQQEWEDLIKDFKHQIVYNHKLNINKFDGDQMLLLL